MGSAEFPLRPFRRLRRRGQASFLGNSGVRDRWIGVRKPRFLRRIAYRHEPYTARRRHRARRGVPGSHGGFPARRRVPGVPRAGADHGQRARPRTCPGLPADIALMPTQPNRSRDHSPCAGSAPPTRRTTGSCCSHPRAPWDTKQSSRAKNATTSPNSARTSRPCSPLLTTDGEPRRCPAWDHRPTDCRAFPNCPQSPNSRSAWQPAPESTRRRHPRSSQRFEPTWTPTGPNRDPVRVITCFASVLPAGSRAATHLGAVSCREWFPAGLGWSRPTTSGGPLQRSPPRRRAESGRSGARSGRR